MPTSRQYAGFIDLVIRGRSRGIVAERRVCAAAA
jgi:hypothetical protein